MEFMSLYYEIKPKVGVFASKEIVWDYLLKVKDWWFATNPEHISLEIIKGGRKIQKGSKLVIMRKLPESLAGLKALFTEVMNQEQVTWEATYYILGLSWLKVFAGVHWKFVFIGEDQTSLTAKVWGISQ